MRTTIACPEAHRNDANQLALCVGLGSADESTYGLPQWQDSSGNLYACASLDVSESFLMIPHIPLEEPSWGCDLVAAERAKGLLVLDLETTPSASPNAITVGVGDPHAVLSAMGLTLIPEVLNG